MLRDYQQRTIDQLYAWFDRNATGNPCLVLPTGSGKSHIIAALCKRVLQEWPDSQILMLTLLKNLRVLGLAPGAVHGAYAVCARAGDLILLNQLIQLA